MGNLQMAAIVMCFASFTEIVVQMHASFVDSVSEFSPLLAGWSSPQISNKKASRFHERLSISTIL